MDEIDFSMLTLVFPPAICGFLYISPLLLGIGGICFVGMATTVAGVKDQITTETLRRSALESETRRPRCKDM